MAPTMKKSRSLFPALLLATSSVVSIAATHAASNSLDGESVHRHNTSTDRKQWVVKSNYRLFPKLKANMNITDDDDYASHITYESEQPDGSEVNGQMAAEEIPSNEIIESSPPSPGWTVEPNNDPVDEEELNRNYQETNERDRDIGTDGSNHSNDKDDITLQETNKRDQDNGKDDIIAEIETTVEDKTEMEVSPIDVKDEELADWFNYTRLDCLEVELVPVMNGRRNFLRRTLYSKSHKSSKAEDPSFIYESKSAKGAKTSNAKSSKSMIVKCTGIDAPELMSMETQIPSKQPTEEMSIIPSSSSSPIEGSIIPTTPAPGLGTPPPTLPVLGTMPPTLGSGIISLPPAQGAPSTPQPTLSTIPPVSGTLLPIQPTIPPVQTLPPTVAFPTVPSTLLPAPSVPTLPPVIGTPPPTLSTITTTLPPPIGTPPPTATGVVTPPPTLALPTYNPTLSPTLGSSVPPAPSVPSLPPVLGTPPTTLTPVLGTPPTTLAPVLGTPPTTLAPVLGTQPTTLAPVLGTPPTTLAPILGTQPTTLAPVVGTPPTTLAPVLGTTPTTLTPVLGTSPTTLTPVLGTPPTTLAPVLVNLPPTALPPATRPPALGTVPPTATRGVTQPPSLPIPTYNPTLSPTLGLSLIPGARLPPPPGMPISFSNTPATLPPAPGTSPSTLSNSTLSMIRPSTAGTAPPTVTRGATQPPSLFPTYSPINPGVSGPPLSVPLGPRFFSNTPTKTTTANGATQPPAFPTYNPTILPTLESSLNQAASISSPPGTLVSNTPTYAFTDNFIAPPTAAGGQAFPTYSPTLLPTLGSSIVAANISSPPVTLVSNTPTYTFTDSSIAPASGLVTFTKCGLLTPNPDSFEVATFPQSPWSTSGNSVWAITTEKASNGSSSLRSPKLVGSSTPVTSNATLQVCDDFLGGVLRTMVYASVEPPRDIFIIYIDGVEAAELVGVNEWQTLELGLTSGAHTIDFSYQYTGKNVTNPTTEGGVWLDEVEIESLGEEPASTPQSVSLETIVQ